MQVILASASPRRRELLRRLFATFEAIPSAVSEPVDGSPHDRALEGAIRKAHDVARRHRGLIVGADTLIALDGLALGKPTDRAEAAGMLAALSGREHQVLTGICVLSTWTGAERTAVETTSVLFRDLADEEIAAYLDTGEADDKAGAYAIQGRGALFVERIEGDFYNVMGLPLCRLGVLLRSMGVDV